MTTFPKLWEALFYWLEFRYNLVQVDNREEPVVEHFAKARRLTHECCNYCNGNCLLLDDGEECVCVQSISYSLLCRWFQAAVLPLDAALYAEIIKDRDEVKRCCECGATFQPKSNRAKYCAACAKRMRRCKEAERQRKRYWQHEA